MVNIILNIILIPLFGLNAAATTTAIAECVGLFILFRHRDRNIKVSNLKEMLKAPIIGSCGIAIVALIVRSFIYSYPVICVVTIILSAMVYGTTLILMKNEFAMSFLKPKLRNWELCSVE